MRPEAAAKMPCPNLRLRCGTSLPIWAALNQLGAESLVREGCVFPPLVAAEPMLDIPRHHVEHSAGIAAGRVLARKEQRDRDHVLGHDGNWTDAATAGFHASEVLLVETRRSGVAGD